MEEDKKLLREEINKFLNILKHRKEICSFEVVCDKTNNTEEDIQQNKMNVSVILKNIYTFYERVEKMRIKVITNESAIEFEKYINTFLKENDENIKGDPIFGITQKAYWTEGYVEKKPVYSAIFVLIE